MSTSTAPAGTRARSRLAARVLGIIFSPRQTFEEIVADPKWLGAMTLLVVLVGALGFAFMSTEVGQEAVLAKQLDSMEAWGMTVTPEIEARLEEGLPRNKYFSLLNGLFWALVVLIEAGILFAVFNAALGGTATFKQVFAVTTWSSVIMALQQVFTTPLAYARGSLDSATNVAILLPMFDDTSFIARFLGMVDLFWIWWLVVLAIGMSVLYKRRTQGILMAFAAVYAVIAVAVAGFFTMRAGS